ncbi:MAG: GTP-binding protein [Promethearchaeota archaeon]|nr:MAG: GTP-binding protein [Candidatus Lokiarchaeota archaeon]
MITMEFQYKIILIGAGAVGKTSIINRFVHDEFSSSYQMTMGVDFLRKELVYEDFNVKLTIWDIAGQERFQFMRKNFYRGSSGALLIFDLTRESTYHTLINKWYPEMLQFLSKKIPFILIGNKVDLIKDTGYVINTEDARNFAETRDSFYIETSAKTGENVEKAFRKLTRRITEKNM